MRVPGAAVRTAVLGSLVAGLLLLLLVGVVTSTLALVVIAGLALHAAEYALHNLLVRLVPRRLGAIPAELHLRLMLQQALVVAFVLRSGRLSPAAESVLLVAVVVHAGLRVAFSAGQLLDEQTRQGSSQVRGLQLPGGHVPAPPALLGDVGLRVLVHAAALPTLGLAWALFTGSYRLVAPAAVLMVLVALGVLLAVGRHLVAVARLPRGTRRWKLVQEAVRRHGPLAVLYSAGGVHSVHQVNTWLGTLDEMRQPTLVMLRDPDVFHQLRPTSTPVVLLPHPEQVTPFSMPSARVALYVANAPENVRLLRNTSLRSAFIGHGDSDKASSANPFCRVYDEVWVAGEAGCQRYLDPWTGVRPEALRIVGRPQVGRPSAEEPRAADAPYTVVYAPTWEGLYGDPYESSLLHSGRDIVSVLLGQEGVRVIYRPHPSTGRGVPAMARESDRIADLVRSAGPQHRVVVGTGVDLRVLFREADALVGDVSGVVSDFLALDKPYFVVNGEGAPPEVFRARVSAAGGGYLVGPNGAGLAEGLADARGADSLAARRAATRTHLLGPRSDDPVETFADAVDALAATLPGGTPQPVVAD